MVEAAAQFLGEIESGGRARWLTLLGPSGTGKTLLARACMRWIRSNAVGFSPWYGINLVHQAFSSSWPIMVSEMKLGDFGSSERLCEIEEKHDGKERPTYAFALIDDVGQIEDQGKSYLIGALSRIADARMGSWTIWTSNLALAQIGELADPRLASRMIRRGNVVIENNCMDFNLRP